MDSLLQTCQDFLSECSASSAHVSGSDCCVTASHLKRNFERKLDALCRENQCIGLKRHLTAHDVDSTAGDDGGICANDGRSLREHGFQPGTADVLLAEFMTREEVAVLRAKLLSTAVGADVKLLRVGAEDPGERTFVSVYDVWNGVVWYCGEGWTDRQQRTLLTPIDKIQSERDKLKFQGALTPEREEELNDQMQIKWKQLRRNREKLHRTVANLYGTLFTLIIRPDFRTGGMTRRHRRLSGPISRRLRLLGFYEFKQTLRLVASRTGLLVMVVDESFTSKICGSCSRYHKALGKSKVFACPQCKAVEERGECVRVHLLLRILPVALCLMGYLLGACCFLYRFCFVAWFGIRRMGED